MGKYTEIWQRTLPRIKEAVRKGGDEIDLNKSDFEEVGKRKGSGYGFRLDIENADVPIKDGTAVARDLKEVLDDDKKFRELAKDKSILIRMGKEFQLEVKVWE